MSTFIATPTPDSPWHCDNCECEITAGRFDLRYSSVHCPRCVTIEVYVESLWDQGHNISWADAEEILVQRGAIGKREDITNARD